MAPRVIEGQQHMGRHRRDQQAPLLAHGLANLRAAGADQIIAFRAGNFGAEANASGAADVGFGSDTSVGL